ncbi:DeoR/GlpR family DNA-binding transcription regulator [Limnochorda pilosa]|uniref:DeoR family transcriptional regulator n=1 Tax=Limnochorda pilosa TaxID=1555112 RepID=A0A0K2SIC1_LIMPI|nr:DeoR/GlpR family DNA-binding transcription regulator [Limnochorda pilosa]BAS26876.1 DeoR family transcriptional regulator [Limnochorda pilosa]
MLAVERRQRMLELLQKHHQVEVREVSQLLGVTPETVRRDLRLLEEEGILERVHGGARLLVPGQAAPPFSARKVAHLAEKRAIAQEALRRLEDGDAVALDTGTTVLELARRLGERHLSVLTYGITLAHELARFPHLRVHVVGGTLYPSEETLVGSEAVGAIRRLRVDKAFMACAGVDAEYGLTVSNSLEAEVKRALVASAGKVYLLADSSKFRRRGLVSYARLEEIDVVITDEGIDPESAELVRGAGVELIVARTSPGSDHAGEGMER